MPYIIKRYANRKLYDPQTSRYVTLDDLRQLIRDGRELRVDDAATGEDLTAPTLTQVLLEGERAGHAALPSTLLHQLIKHGEAWYSLLQRSLRTSLLDQWPTSPQDVERVWQTWAKLAGWPAEPAAAPAADATKTGPKPSASLEQEVATLKAQLQALEERLPRRQRAATSARRRRKTRRA